MGASDSFGCSLLNQQTMSDAEQFLQQIGFDNSHLPEIFNDDDKSFYTIGELIQAYADQEVETYKRENTFDEWCKKYAKPQGENVYLYNKTAYSLHELILIFKQQKPKTNKQ